MSRATAHRVRRCAAGRRAERRPRDQGRVYITPNSIKELLEIGLLTALWEDETGKGFDCKWAYRAGHIAKGVPADAHPREIFYTETEDGNPLGGLEW